ncbi:MAG: AAA family ATPase [Candidatus Eutrophobiaceae bacterium]
MIESIKIAALATYDKNGAEMSGLKKVNFIYGSNGTGKTTIARVVRKQDNYPECTVRHRNGDALEPFVCNSDYVKENFDQADSLEGIFTLGKENIDKEKEIDIKKSALIQLNDEISEREKALNGDGSKKGKQQDLAKIESSMSDKAWETATKYKQHFKASLTGSLRSKIIFLTQVKSEYSSNEAELKDLDELKLKEEIIFSEGAKEEKIIQRLSYEQIVLCESNAILGKKVIGKEDVDVAKMIEKLGNINWVRGGRDYFEMNNYQICPFCQQKTADDFAHHLNEYFDEAFNAGMEEIEILLRNYRAYQKEIMNGFEKLEEISGSGFLNKELIEKKQLVVSENIGKIIELIERKKQNPSDVFQLDSLESLFEEIRKAVDKANSEIEKHNKIIQNLGTEKEKHTKQVWQYIVNDLRTDIQEYERRERHIRKEIQDLEKENAAKKKERETMETDIATLEQQITSVVPVVDKINGHLSSVGFSSFTLKAIEDHKYKLVRLDGSDAKENLSEGEKSFVVFLYFYFSIEGNNDQKNISSNRIVVFDDPVSSLDSDILFIVTRLIRQLIDKVCDGKDKAKQIFVLTHNIYFHKELTFKHRKNYTYWIVRKLDGKSKIKKYDSNPISSSYELLWREFKSGENSATLPNCMRRILEHYFMFTGSLGKLDKLLEELDETEKIIGRSLLSWINAGSHGVLDNLFVSVSESEIDTYRSIFQKIFEVNGHGEHYQMMCEAASKIIEK